MCHYDLMKELGKRTCFENTEGYTSGVRVPTLPYNNSFKNHFIIANNLNFTFKLYFNLHFIYNHDTISYIKN